MNIDVKEHHFSSSSKTEVCTYEKSCQVKCLNNANALIPAHKIKIYEMNKLSTFIYFNTNSFDKLTSFNCFFKFGQRFTVLTEILTRFSVRAELGQESNGDIYKFMYRILIMKKKSTYLKNIFSFFINSFSVKDQNQIFD